MAGPRIYDAYQDGPQPTYASDKYARTAKMAPKGLVALSPRTASELTGPSFAPPPKGDRNMAEGKTGWALGQLIRVVVRVLDEDARPQEGALVEIWHANAAGKYQHPVDGRDAPLDENFRSWGRGLADANGEVDFLTIRPGAYPVPNTGNWWRPPHIHISAYGDAFASRIISQIYFPGDPLNPLDGILNGIPDEKARARLMLQPDADVGIHEMALGYRFDLVLRGRAATPTEG